MAEADLWGMGDLSERELEEEKAWCLYYMVTRRSGETISHKLIQDAFKTQVEDARNSGVLLL